MSQTIVPKMFAGKRAAYLFGVAALAALIQTGIVGYMIESRASILRNGTDILLRTAPIDPRDLLRGDYVILNYDISNIPADIVVGEWPVQAGRYPVYVRLVPGEDGFYSVSEASFQALPPREDSVILKSLPSRYYAWQGQGDRSPLRISYGIERYFVPEGEGLVLEEARNEQRVTIAARVSDGGTAQIRALLLDGEPVYEEPVY